ncbi:MAG: ferritin-like domain-containing protein [Actinobacteria bacterium]|nr:ferritin-like domain-containing protein [Actinomycetota bacterium]
MDQPGIDHRALHRVTAEVDRQHREAMHTIERQMDETIPGEPGPRGGHSRRQFLRRAGIGSATLAIGATTVSIAALMPQATGQTAGTAELTPGDSSIIGFAQGLELAAVDAYRAAVATNRLPVAINETARTFGLHHEDHAKALGTLAGKAAPNTANPQLVQLFAPQIESASSETAIMQVLYNLEQAAAATYELALGELEMVETAKPVSTILPVEGQHAVVWGQQLELPVDQWLPNFQSKSDALDPARFATS